MHLLEVFVTAVNTSPLYQRPMQLKKQSPKNPDSTTFTVAITHSASLTNPGPV